MQDGEYWVVTGDMNGHIGLINEKVNRNGQMLLDFAECTKLKIKHWELENPATWHDNTGEAAIDYILVNKKVQEKGCTIWKNEDINISDHFLIGVTCGKAMASKK